MSDEENKQNLEDLNPEDENRFGENVDDQEGAENVSDDEPSPEEVITNQQSEIAALKDQILRARAETENVRRRADRDRQDASAYAVTGFARDMLTVSDNLQRALDSIPEDVADDTKTFVEGVEMTGRELLNTMERYGIKKVEPEVGEKFDHKFHQAMFEVPTEEQAPGTVMQVVAPGYVIKDRLLRPAMVGVAKGEKKAVDTEA
ncbi:nucleotide exchange factor GrpE [Kordiimonas aquimaris]|uniref:nucleotide exchange factor GrpE n=1 Tax=Kordiimonas aquimaris TaxID=707591 RepID=UPI0021D0FC24|nr:nucleotide exchange factor GrpE [Kordiimonas aquimaris]